MKTKQTKKGAKPAPVAPGTPATAKPASSGRWLWICALAVAFVAVFWVYSPALSGPFLFDDRYVLRQDIEGLPLRFQLSGVRPVLTFTFWLNSQLSNLRSLPPGDLDKAAFSFHIINVLFHFADAVLIALIAARLLTWVKVDGNLRRILGIFAGGLFLLHPVQTESVAYISSRSENLGVLLFNSALAVFLYRRSVAASLRIAAAVLILLAAAFFTKEHAAALPALLLLTDYFWNPGFSFEGIRRNWRLYAPIAVGAIGAMFFVWRLLFKEGTAGFGLKEFTWYQYFFSQCRAIWVYVRLFFLPFGQNVDYDFPVSKTILDQGALFGLIALVAVAAAAWIYRRRYPLASYGFFTFLVLLAPTSSFIPIKDLLAERRMYLPFIGLLLIVLELLRRWKIRQTALAALLAAVLLVEGALAYQRNQVWSGPIALWSDTVSKSPKKKRPHFQLGFAYYDQNQCALALTEYIKAAQIDMNDYTLWVDAALASDCIGKPAEAITQLRQAARIQKTAHVYATMGMIYGKYKRQAEALDALATAEKIDPNFETTYVYRGNVFLNDNDVPRATEEFRHALKINPNNQMARQALNRLGQ